jgi:hypothetical protein
MDRHPLFVGQCAVSHQTLKWGSDALYLVQYCSAGTQEIGIVGTENAILSCHPERSEGSASTYTKGLQATGHWPLATDH